MISKIAKNTKKHEEDNPSTMKDDLKRNQKKSDEEIQALLEAEVKKLSEANLAPYKAPTVVVLHRDELPKTSTRKVKRKDLKEWYESL